MAAAAVAAEFSAVVDEADPVRGGRTAVAVLVAGTGGTGRPLRQDCLVARAAAAPGPPGAASRVRAAPRRHGRRQLGLARSRSATSVTVAKRWWTLTIGAGAWPGEPDAYDVVAVLDRCRRTGWRPRALTWCPDGRDHPAERDLRRGQNHHCRGVGPTAAGGARLRHRARRLHTPARTGTGRACARLPGVAALARAGRGVDRAGAALLGGPLVVPQTVLVAAYWAELRDGLARQGLPVRHFVLHSDRATLTRRIEEDTVETGARQWRLDHLAEYEAALPWLREAGTVLDTTGVPPREAALRIAAAAEDVTAG